MTEHEKFLAEIKTEIHLLIENPLFLKWISDFEDKLPPDVQFLPFDDETETAFHSYEPDPDPTAIALLLPPLLDQCIAPETVTPEQNTNSEDIRLAAKCFFLAALYDSQADPCSTPILTRRDAAATVWDFYGRLSPRCEFARGAKIRAFIRCVLTDVQKAINRKPPLSNCAAMIYEKLRSLPSHKGMTTPEIQEWFYDQTRRDEGAGKNLDEGTWKRYRKKLESYGLKNAPRIGYFIEK